MPARLISCYKCTSGSAEKIGTYVLQKLHASLDEKELSPETGISASDEVQYESAIYTFEQYGDSLKYIDQINTHGYHSKPTSKHLVHPQLASFNTPLLQQLLFQSMIFVDLLDQLARLFYVVIVLILVDSENLLYT